MTRLNNRYPVSVVLAVISYNLLAWVLGTVICWLALAWLGLAYAILVVSTLVWLSWARCRHCFYHGRLCASGLGLISGLLFKRADKTLFPKRFHLSWPNLLVWTVPGVVGLALLFFRDMDWLMVVLTGAFVLMAWFSGKVSRTLACKTCAQRQVCPMITQQKQDKA